MVCCNLGSLASNMVSPPITQGYHWEGRGGGGHVDEQKPFEIDKWQTIQIYGVL